MVFKYAGKSASKTVSAKGSAKKPRPPGAKAPRMPGWMDDERLEKVAKKPVKSHTRSVKVVKKK